MTDSDRPIVDARRLVQNLLTAIAPGFDPYVLLSSQCPPANCVMRNSLGCAGPLLDLAAEPWLRERDEWRGREPAVFVDDSEIFRQAIEHFLGVTIHEVAHIYDSGIDRSQPTPVTRKFALEECTAYSDAICADPERPPWASHQAEFVRRAAHVRYAAMRGGMYTPIGCVIDTGTYGLGSIASYWHWLCPELQRQYESGASIWELAIVRPPQEFIDQWCGDVEAWRDKQENLGSSTLLYVEQALRYGAET